MTGGLAIEARQLTKRYGDIAAVDGFDLAVPVGTVVSLLGPNGPARPRSSGCSDRLVLMGSVGISFPITEGLDHVWEFYLASQQTALPGSNS